MSTEYIICKKPYSEKNTINLYLINKYKNKLTNIINENDFLQVKFEQIKGLYNFYMCDNQQFIKFIRKNEPNNYKSENSYIFITIQDKFKKYLTFYIFDYYDLDNINTIILLKNDYFIDYYNNEDNQYTSDFICIS